ncbi:MAG: SBBP repeat-containing protein [Anaerolineae bacterium]|nr:SBBP repeat-containing protein [Anaerolineae bacterium]
MSLSHLIKNIRLTPVVALAFVPILLTVPTEAARAATEVAFNSEPLPPESGASATSPVTQSQVEETLHTAPIMFIEYDNRPSVTEEGKDRPVKTFQMQGAGGSIILTPSEMWISVLQTPEIDPAQSRHFLDPEAASEPNTPIEGVTLKISFDGANPNPRIEGFDPLDTTVSFFKGSDPDEWHTEVPVWGGVRYTNLYPGIDLVVTSRDGAWHWRLDVREDTDPTSQSGSLPKLISFDRLLTGSPPASSPLDAVSLRIEGAEGLSLLSGGEFSLQPAVGISTNVGEYALPLLDVVGAGPDPSSTPEVTGEVIETPFSDAAMPKTLARSAYQSGISDLLYSTYLGGAKGDMAYDVAIDQNGAAYIIGRTYSPDFPKVPGSYDEICGTDNLCNATTDVFVAKIDTLSIGTASLVYATFIGGSGRDDGGGIAVDSLGRAYIAGWTSSSDFPRERAYDDSYGGGNNDDAFVTQLSADGKSLEYSTYLGGPFSDWADDIALGDLGVAYIVGSSESSKFPTTPDAYDRVCGDGTVSYDDRCSWDIVVAKIDTSLSGVDSLIYSTFLGGMYAEGWESDIAVDALGRVYVVDLTASSDFPTEGGFDTTCDEEDDDCSQDAFLTVIDTTLPGAAGLVYSTYIGGSDWDFPGDVAVSEDGMAYVTGMTKSPDFPRRGAFDNECNVGNTGRCSDELFVMKIDPTVSGDASLIYSTYLGGSSNEYRGAIAVDQEGIVYVTGTTSGDFFYGEAYPIHGFAGKGDAFLAKLSADGATLLYFTYLGGSENDNGFDVAVADDGIAYIVGWTSSTNFPFTTSAYQPNFQAGSDAFLTKLATSPQLVLSVSAPDALSVVDDQYSPNPFDIIATISNNNELTAKDVQLTLDLTDAPGLSLVSGTPTQSIGNLEVGYERQVIWRILATTQSASTIFSYQVTATASNASSKTEDRQITLPGTSSQAITVDILDGPEGSPVSALSLEDGWPTPNPLTVRVTLQDTLPEGEMLLVLQLGSSDDQARFYVSSSTLPVADCTLASGPDKYSFNQYSVGCPVVVHAQETIFTLEVWIQPSSTAMLDVKARILSYAQGLLGQDQASVSIPRAEIYPIVFIPGLGGTQPPMYVDDYHNTWLADGVLLAANEMARYKDLYTALEKLGYERNRTYFLFPYDWLVHVVSSARLLHNKLLVPAAAEIASPTTGVPWVAGYGGDAQDIEFDLIGHSTGNLIIRAYLEAPSKGPSTTEEELYWDGYVRRYVSIAGTHKGLPLGYVMFEGIEPEPGDTIARLAMWLWAPPRARASGYFHGACPSNDYSCVGWWSDEEKYLFVHDPLFGITVLPGFLPTYEEFPYLVDVDGTPYPEGRLANPLLQSWDEKVSNNLLDPYFDNLHVFSNLLKRYPDRIADLYTPYYGLNDPDNMQRLRDRMRDPVDDTMINVCNIFAGVSTREPKVDPEDKALYDTRVKLTVMGQQNQAPYWLTGKLFQGWFADGDRAVPAVSGDPTNLWIENLRGWSNLDTDPELQDNDLTTSHTTIVGYGITHKHIAECLIGIAPSFLENDSDSGDQPEGGVAAQALAPAPSAVTPSAASENAVDLYERALAISAQGPVEMTLVDPQGRRLGYSSATSVPWWEIPFGSYTVDSDLGYKYLLIFLPETGNYTLSITSAGTGEYTILGSYYDQTGGVSLFSVQGQAAPGAANTQSVTIPVQAIDVPQPPSVQAGPDMSVVAGQPITFAGRYSDINAADTHSVAWDFGDGATAQDTLTPAHTYLFSGVYTTGLTITDSSGFAITDTLQVTVIAPGDLAGLVSLLDQMYAQGQINNHGIYQSLRQRLLNAQRDLENDKPEQAIKKLQDFQKQVDKEAGKHITPQAAATLKTGVDKILEGLQ